MTLGDWIIIGILCLGFIITWIACSKGDSEDTLEYEPFAIYPDKTRLECENETLRHKVYALERELYFRRYDRPTPVDINLDVKVETNEHNISVS